MQSNASGWSESAGNSQPLPHIKEQHEASPFNHAPSDAGTQVRATPLSTLPGCVRACCVHHAALGGVRNAVSAGSLRTLKGGSSVVCAMNGGRDSILS